MTPKELYPIGTQLITRRRSQAALYLEIFEECSFALIEGEPHNFITYEKAYTWNHITNKLAVNHHYWFADAWKVIVTEENQKWLSSVPMVGDLVWIENMGMAFEIGAIADNVVFKSAHKSPFADTESGHFVSNFYCSIEDNPKIISRIYPNNQRAPLIAFDEVLVPTIGELS